MPLIQTSVIIPAETTMGRDERDVQFLTYTTLDGNVIDLRSLTAAERAYFARCYEAFRHGMSWEDFTELSVGPTHLLLRDTGGVITPSVYDHPLFRATRDLEDRLGILQQMVGPDPGDDVAHDPVTGQPIGHAAGAAAQPATV
jgi:hypothetical protein